MLKTLDSEESKARYPYAFTDTVVQEVLQRGFRINARARGASMYPLIDTGDIVLVEPTNGKLFRTGDILFFKGQWTIYVLHRLIRKTSSSSIVTRGDNAVCHDNPVDAGHVLGRVVEIKHQDRRLLLTTRSSRIFGYLIALFGRFRFRGQVRVTRLLNRLCWAVGGRRIK
jgi:signal peptidase I